MSLLRTLCQRALAAAALIALPVATMAASTGPLHIQNNEPGTIVLSSQSPGVCGEWISPIAPGAPPPSVAGSSTSGQFSLLVPPSCSIGINAANMTYVSSGEVATFCTYSITGNASFSFSASGNPGCKVLFTPQGVYFVFPDTGGVRTRGHVAKPH